jgi:hypothetical protein
MRCAHTQARLFRDRHWLLIEAPSPQLMAEIRTREMASTKKSAKVLQNFALRLY